MAQPQPRSPLSVGIEWASRVTSLGLEFALPTLVGVFADRRLGSGPVGTLIGAVLGFLIGMMHLLRIAREGASPGPGGGSKAG